MWTSKIWASEARQKMIESLEVEFSQNPSELLKNHILQLKEKWGMVCLLPSAA